MQNQDTYTIGINLLPLYPTKIGGMENYVRETIQQLAVLPEPISLVLILNQYAFDTFTDTSTILRIQINDSIKDIQLHSSLHKIINDYHIDFWLCPLLELVPRITNIPSGVTIPDMQHAYHPSFFDKTTLKWRKQTYFESAHLANIVFTISDFSKQSLSKCLQIPSQKICTTHLDCSPIFKIAPSMATASDARDRLKLPKEYIHYCANFWPHKNHNRLIKAFEIYTSHHPQSQLELLLTGNPDEFAPIKKIIDKSKCRDRIRFLGHIDQQDLPELYRNSSGLLFPSLFEGFGIPLLEAMHCQCPVACSRNTSLPEIGKDAVYYFDPENPQDIAAAIHKLAEGKDTEIRITAGLQKASAFSYKQCAQQTFNRIKQEITAFRTTNYIPKVSIITPSFNQGEFIEETIKSVVSQPYENLEYIIMDGGSTDNSVGIIKKYAEKYPFIQWISQKDGGQTDAINKGIQKSSGEIIAYLNSDDTYYPQTIPNAVEYFKANPELQLVYGEGTYVDKSSNEICRYNTQVFHEDTLMFECYICQPTTFIRRKAFNEVGPFNDNLKSCMDYEYWIRFSQKHPLYYVPNIWATSRMYPDNKTIGQRGVAFSEIIKTVKKYYHFVPMSWVNGLADYKINRVDQFFEKKETFGRKMRFLSLLLYLRYNISNPKRLLTAAIGEFHAKAKRRHP